MYEPESILVLKEPRTVGTPAEGDPESEDYKPASDDYKPFPYDRVRVVGPSPVHHGVTNAEWQGASGQGVIITPLSGFGSTLDEPYGKLVALYDVESTPDHTVPANPVRVINPTSGSAGPTPEEQLADHASANPSEPTRRQRRRDARSRPASPLEDPRPTEAETSPLGS